MRIRFKWYNYWRIDPIYLYNDPDEQIYAIQRSTRTTIKQLQPLHEYFRKKSPWYYKWHIRPISHKIHYAILGTYLIFLAFAFIFASSTAPKPTKATTGGPNYAGTGTGTGSSWTDPTNATGTDNVYATWSGAGMGPSFADSEIKIIKGGTIKTQNKSVGASWDSTEAFYSYGGSSDLWGETWTADDINASNFGVALNVEDSYNSGYSGYLQTTNFSFGIPAGATINGITAEIERKVSSDPGPPEDKARVDSVRITIDYTVASGPYTCTSASAGEGTWGDASTWANCNGGIPGAEDSVVIAVDSPVYMEPWEVTIASLTVNDGAELYLYGNSLTVTGDVDIQFILDASGATLKVGGNFTMPYYYDTGSYYGTTFSGSTIEFTSSSAGKTIDFGGVNTPNNLVFSGSGGWSLSNDTAIGGNLSLTDAAADLDINGKNFTVTGTLSNTGTLKMTGGETTVSLTNDTDSGTIEYYGTSGPYTTKNLTYYNLKINGAATTFNQYNGAITANGTFNLAAGTYAQGGNDLTVKKDFTIASSGATFTKATGSAKLKFLGDLAFTGPTTAQNLGILEIGASPDTTNLASDLVADSLTIGAGDILNTKGYDLDIGGNVVLNTGSPGGTIDTTDGTTGYEGDGTNINVAGNFTINSGGVFTKCVQSSKRSKIIMDGGATKTLTSDGDDLGDFQTSTASTHIDMQDNTTFGNITVDTSTLLDTVSGSNRTITATATTIVGTITANASTINISGAWDASGGTFTMGTSTLKLTDGSIKDKASYPWNEYNNVEMGLSGSTTTLLSNISCMTFTLGTGTVTDGASSFSITVQKAGDAFVDNGGTITIATFYYRCNTGGSQNVVARDYSGISTLGFYGVGGATGNLNYNMQGNLIANAIVMGPNNSGTNTRVDTLNTAGFNITATSLSVGKSGYPLYYGKLNMSGSSIVDINGNVTIQTSGDYGNNVIESTSGTPTIKVSGNWTNNDVFTAGSTIVEFDGTVAQSITGANTFYDLTINNGAASPSDTVDVDPNAVQTVSNTLTVTDGQWTPYTGDIYKNVSIGANGILKPDTSANINVSGSWTNSGTFTANSGTVTFTGTSTCAITGSTTFNNLTMDTTTDGAKTITFPTGSSNKQIISGTWTLDGASGNVLTLASASPTTAWYFQVTAPFTAGDFINVTDSWSANSNKITPGANTTNGGNNDGWVFNTPPSNTSLTFTNPYSGTSTSAIADDTTEWSFRAVVSDTDGYTDLDNVYFNLANASDNSADPTYDSIKLKWTRTANPQFTEEADTQNAITLTSQNSDTDCAGNQCTLDFKIQINNSFTNVNTAYQYGGQLLTTDSAVTTQNNYADLYQVDELTLSMDVDNATLSFGSLLPGTIVTDTTIVTVSTNYSQGYSLSINDNVDGSNSTLLHTDTTTRIPDYTGTISTPTAWDGTGLGICLYLATDKDTDQWGTGNTATHSSNKYAGVPKDATVIHTKAGSPTTNDESSIGYKLVVENSQKTGNYSGSVLFTVTGLLN